MEDLPPLNPLRAFEAAARHMSMRKAAEELYVTPGAISRQVKALESHLGYILFHRLPNEIILTAEGDAYFKPVSKYLHEIALATKALVGSKVQDAIHIRAYTTFAGKWLIPRLSSFSDLYPGIEIRLSTSVEAVDFERENVDAAIRLGDGGFPGLETVRLVENHLAPLCTPEYARRTGLTSARDLNRARLLHSLARPEDWRAWIETAGLGGVVDWYAGPKYGSSMLASQAALDHQGIMIAQKSLFGADLEAGRLVQPFGPIVDQRHFTYYLVYPRNRLRNHALRRFQAWLEAECAMKEGGEAAVAAVGRGHWSAGPNPLP
ncbi:MAG: LysR family transcriptional regulator [Rhodovulum sulfidophilum]|uniref:LysR family transcriptional regulator n=1 Tax=Rhodovulum sulfidophilum TaxID=35806 RepID=A0A2W5MX08_RHOSU|nr:MAG: LysR family transcriptional regulator [Rhodovulum sulfidophilum]